MVWYRFGHCYIAHVSFWIYVGHRCLQLRVVVWAGRTAMYRLLH